MLQQLFYLYAEMLSAFSSQYQIDTSQNVKHGFILMIEIKVTSSIQNVTKY